MQYQRKEQYAALKDKLIRAARISTSELLARLPRTPPGRKE
ncbi:MAG TPA: hypothetical protein VMN03_08140 [Burkholderiales bacterium]|nr:hypothetical protein [Burkholderiales bacterium]